jgi:hypothetical protein
MISSNWFPLRFSRPSNHVWLILLLVIALFNFPFFLKAHFPLHDSLFFLQIFKYYYSSILYFGEPPLWVPHTGFGIPFDYYRVQAIGPFQHLACGLGLLVKAQDVKTLFFLSLSFDMYFAALGLYLLAKESGASSLGALAAALAVVGTLFPDMQLDFNYKMMLPVPFCMYLLLRFVRSFDARFALGCVATLIGFTYGMASYLLVVQFYILVIWLTGLILFKQMHVGLDVGLRTFRSTILHPVSLLLLAVSAVGAFGLWQALHQTFLELQPMVPARDPSTGAVPLDQFLTYGGNTNGYKLLEMTIGLPVSRDFKFYTGALCLAIAAYALFICRRKSIVWAAFSTVVVALLFTIPDFTPVARLSYYLPGMNKVRHIGDMTILAKPALCIIVAIGLSDIAAYFDEGRRLGLLKSCAGVAAASTAGAALAARNLWGGVLYWPPIVVAVYFFVGFACAVALLWSFGQRSRMLGALVVLALGGVLALILFLPSATLQLSADYFYAPFRPTFPWIWLSSVVVLLLVCAGLKSGIAFSAAISVVIALGAADIFIYRALILAASPSFNTRYERNVAIAEPLRWRPTRVADSEEAIVQEVFGRVDPSASASYGFRNTYLNIDSCNLQRQDLLARGIVDLRLARETGLPFANLQPGTIDLSTIGASAFVISGDGPFARALGCNVPKLQIVPEPIYADNDKAATLIKARPKQGDKDSSDTLPRIDLNPIIDEAAPPLESRGQPQDANATIVEFSPNRLVADISNPYQTDAWIVYLDAFIPRWRAEADGVSTKTRRVNLAFKGILVSPGPHRIGFYLDDAMAVDTTVLGSIGLGVWGLLSIVFCFFQLRRVDKVKEGAVAT